MQARWCKAYFAYLLDPSLSIGAKVTLCVLRSYCPPNAYYCYPSLRRLQASINCSRHSLQRYLAELEQAEWIQRKYRERLNGSRTTTKYLLMDDTKSLVKECSERAKKHRTPRAKFDPRGVVSEEHDLKYGTDNTLQRKIVPYPSPKSDPTMI